MKEKVLIAMSGGTDSTAAAVLLRDEYDIAGGTMLLNDTDQARQDIADAAEVCRCLGIPHYVADFRDVFRQKVIDSFAQGYVAGQTPNPCLVCNKYIKFGAFLDWAQDMGFSKIATGHYVRKVADGSGEYLCAPKDTKKDQTYVLYSLTPDQISRSLFPLGDLTKAEAKELAKGVGLERNRDSQDICFIPDGDYAAFIEQYLGRKDTPGKFVDTLGNVMGDHKGVWHYTVGQRKGLGVGFGKPVYVLGKDPATRRVILGDNEELFSTRVSVRDLNFMVPTPAEPCRIQAKIRYSTTAADALLVVDGDRATLEFDVPQRAATPGQAAVFYSDGRLLGGGVIIGKEE